MNNVEIKVCLIILHYYILIVEDLYLVYIVYFSIMYNNVCVSVSASNSKWLPSLQNKWLEIN